VGAVSAGDPVRSGEGPAVAAATIAASSAACLRTLNLKMEGSVKKTKMLRHHFRYLRSTTLQKYSKEASAANGFGAMPD